MRALLRTAAPGALAASLALAAAACSHRPARPHAEPAPQPSRDDAGARAPQPEAQGAGVPVAAPPQGDPCEVRVAAGASPGWTLVGLRPGPTLRDVAAVDARRLVATTGARVCTSDDDGARWTERLAAPSRELRVASLARVAAGRRAAFVAVLRRGRDDASPVEALYASRDGDAERWDPVVLPERARGARGVFADARGRLFVATPTTLFESEDLGASWSEPRALPGREARDVDACGAVLISRARVDDDWFYHRSFDRGRTWRAFRLGAIGLEGNGAMLRCVSETGGIEAGRAPLPTHWSWDWGRTWTRAPYDARSLRIARAFAEDPEASGVAPRCRAAPDRLTQCADTGRMKLVSRSGHVQDVDGPSSCERVAQVDARRTVAYGATCGLFVSRDRGGLWRPVTQSLAPRPAGAFAEGRGGFLDARTAWRLDGGIWWTFDGGAHWRAVYSHGVGPIERGVFVDARHGVFATADGWVIATRDGGRRWTFILRGDVERIASARRTVVVTTTQAVRVSPDGGVTWLASAYGLPREARLDPTVEVRGTERSITLATGARVTQRGDRVVLTADSTDTVLARGLPPGLGLLAAHADARGVDRVLLDGGVVVARTDATASRTPVARAARRAARAPAPLRAARTRRR